jgi:hypothetical protein
MNEIVKQQMIEALLKDLAGDINRKIENKLGQMGFALLVFEFGKPGIGNYISNAQRETMIETLRETADRLENRQDIPPAPGKTQ